MEDFPCRPRREDFGSLKEHMMALTPYLKSLEAWCEKAPEVIAFEGEAVLNVISSLSAKDIADGAPEGGCRVSRFTRNGEFLPWEAFGHSYFPDKTRAVQDSYFEACRLVLS